MAASSLSSKTSHHVRSNSFPLEPHPIISQVNKNLCRLRASSDTISSSPSQKLIILQDLFDSFDQILLLPLAQRSLAQTSHDELLEGSLRLLDLCDTFKDSLLQTKESTQHLQSVLRRKRVCEMGFAYELRKCLKSKKTIEKKLRKAVLKGTESKFVEKNHEDFSVVGLLKEAEVVTFEVVKSLLSFTLGSKPTFKLISKWGLVSKILRSRRLVCDKEDNQNEIFQVVDETLQLITANPKVIESDFSVQIQNLQNSLGKFNLKIQDVEEGLDSLCRRLIKTRVSLLNILNN